MSVRASRARSPLRPAVASHSASRVSRTHPRWPGMPAIDGLSGTQSLARFRSVSVTAVSTVIPRPAESYAVHLILDSRAAGRFSLLAGVDALWQSTEAPVTYPPGTSDSHPVSRRSGGDASGRSGVSVLQVIRGALGSSGSQRHVGDGGSYLVRVLALVLFGVPYRAVTVDFDVARKSASRPRIRTCAHGDREQQDCDSALPRFRHGLYLLAFFCGSCRSSIPSTNTCPSLSTSGGLPLTP